MPHDLSPEWRRELEEFIREVAETTEALSPAERSRLKCARTIAELILRTAGPDGTEDDRRALAELLADESSAPWSWVEREPGAGYRKWIADRVPRNANERRHKRQTDFAEKAVLGWIGHPAVAPVVEAARPELVALVDPLHMTDQGVLTFVTAYFLDCVSHYPDGTEWPNPFTGAPPDVMEVAERIRPTFVARLEQLATRIEAADVPLDPNDPAVLLVLAQLTLIRLELTRPPADIVADLNIWPPGYIDREAATRGQVAVHASRHGRNARFQADLAAGGETVARRLGPPAIRGPYAGGGKRRKSAVERRRAARIEAVRNVLRLHPDVTAGRLIATWDSGHSTPGGQLRTQLGLLTHDRPPSEATLRADLRELRR